MLTTHKLWALNLSLGDREWHLTFLHSYSKAESSWKHSQSSELPLPLKIRWLPLLGTEAQLNKLLQNGIFDFKLNVKHSYTVLEYPGLPGRSAAYCMQNIRRWDRETQASRKAGLQEGWAQTETDKPCHSNFPQGCCHSAPRSSGSKAGTGGTEGMSSGGFAGQGKGHKHKEEPSNFCHWTSC